jgi:hypothetical protein
MSQIPKSFLNQITAMLHRAEEITKQLDASAARDQADLRRIDADLLICEQRLAQARADEASHQHQRRREMDALMREQAEIEHELLKLDRRSQRSHMRLTSTRLLRPT